LNLSEEELLSTIQNEKNSNNFFGFTIEEMKQVLEIQQLGKTMKFHSHYVFGILHDL
jgi:hypothetical protein